MVALAPHKTILFDGAELADVVSWTSDSERDKPSSAEITVAGVASVTLGQVVDIQVAGPATEAERRCFWGLVTNIEPSWGSGGIETVISCRGWAWVLDLELEDAIVFGGGAPTDAVVLGSGVKHIGDTSYTWYAVHAADGLTVDYLFSPATDARFVRVTGRLHGSNSYDTDPDQDIRDFSRIDVYQGGRKLGYVNLPVSQERHDDELDYTDDANWEDFDCLIGCEIDGSGGAVTLRFVSGTKPGTTTRDNYEVKGVSYQTAGQTGLRQLCASLMKNRGFGASQNGVPYRIKTIKDREGHEIMVGGNGLVNNGRIALEAGERPWSTMCEFANLFGYHGICGPNSVDIQAMRGDPESLSIDATFLEGVNILSIRLSEPSDEVATDWTVTGASGSDENGDPFQYESRTAGAPNASWMPDPPGVIARTLTHDLLTSDKLCQQAREVQEVETTVAPTLATLEIVPTAAIRVGSVVQVTHPTLGLDRAMWVTRIMQQWSENGWWTTIDVRAPNGAATPEEDPAVDPETPPDTGVYHIGTSSIAWYAAAPGGATVTLDWYVGSEPYRAVRITGRMHGANSYPSGSGVSTWSQVQVWQYGTKIAEINLPKAPERYASQLDYTNDAYWSDLDLIVAADIDGTAAQLKFTRGQAIDGTNDHYEVKSIAVQLYSEANERGPLATSGVDWHAWESRRRYRWL